MTEWVEKAADEAAVTALVAAGFSRLLSKLLAQRGVTVESAPGYFRPSVEGLAKPDELPGIVRAADTILDALAADPRGKIVVFGDYDCDGICATAIVVTALKALRANVAAFIPRRSDEGYGMTAASVKRLLVEQPDVRFVVTVDNGVGANVEIAELRERGIKVVVTDHHLPNATLPVAEALVNPKVDAPDHLDSLCGSAVAFFLVNRLVSEAKARGLYSGPGIGEPLLVMAGLATITDIMPITGQNRILVAESLRRFLKPDLYRHDTSRRGAPRGLKELYLRAAKAAKPALTTRDYGFTIGPRINAVGRLEGEHGSAMDVFDLLVSNDREECRALVGRIEECNASRRGVEQGMTDRAMERVDPEAAAQVIAFSSSEPGIHPGVAGIVASRVLEGLKTKVPVAVLVDGKGSARAPAFYNVRAALDEAAAYLGHYGGHAGAAGLAVTDGNLEVFTRVFREACAKQAAAIPAEERAAVRLDAWVSACELTVDFAEKLGEMEPFGEGNPEPVFGLKEARLDEVRLLGREGKHLSVSVSDRTGALRGVWWGRGGELEALRAKSGSPVRVRFALTLSNYGGVHVELRVLDLETI